MADQTYKVQDPSGNIREIQGPEGATDEQVLAQAKILFSETPGGAVTGAAAPKTPNLTRAGEAGMDIGGATTIGGVMGAMAPEVLTGAASVARSIPQGARFAPWLEQAAIAAKYAGRPAGALSGAMSGAGSETVGQMLDESGAPDWLSFLGRTTAGGMTPEVANGIMYVWQKKLPTSIDASMMKQLAKKAAAFMQGTPQDIGAEEAALLTKLSGELRGGAPSEAPAKGIYDVLRTGAKNKYALGEQEAQKIIGNANARISEELDAATKGPVAYAGKAQERIATRGQEAVAAAQSQRLNVGQELDPSDIGNPLRTVITDRNQVLIDARNTAFKETEKLRDAAVAAQEGAGKFINKSDEYDALVQDLLREKRGRSPDVQSAFDKILYQIKNPEKDVFGQDKPLSFQVFDDVRRQLGQVFKGEAPEGYAAIDAATARKYYAKISELQKNYAGPEHEKLLTDYAEAKEGLTPFLSRAGKKFTAVDRYDDTKFQTDPASLPKTFFKTRQSVADLIELTGNRDVAVQSGKDFATGELKGKTEAQVQTWMRDNRDWLSALPEVREAVTKYANHLGYGEQVSRAAQVGVERLKQYSAMQQAQAQQRAGAVESQAGQQAAAVTRQRGQEAISLLGPQGEMFPVQNVKALIESGKSDQWALAAPLIHASPGGKEMLADAIRQSLADRAETSIKGLTTFFGDKIVPALTETRLMNPTEIQKIAGQLKAIENMSVPEREKLGIAKRIILQSFAGYASSVGARATTSLVNMIPGGAPPEARSGLERFPQRYGP